MALDPIKAAKAAGKNIGDTAKAVGKNVKDTANAAGKVMKQAVKALARVQKDAAKAQEQAKETLAAEQYQSCKKIIDQSATVSRVVGGGLAQLPAVDYFIIGPRNVKMVSSLGEVFGLNYTEAASAAVLEQLTTSTLGWAIAGRAFAQIFVGRIPVVGNVHNAEAAAAITNLLGWKTALDLYRNSSQMEPQQEQEDSELTRDALIQQAGEFLSGAKSYEKDKNAYKRLMNAMDAYDRNHEDEYDQEFDSVYRKLTELCR